MTSNEAYEQISQHIFNFKKLVKAQELTSEQEKIIVSMLEHLKINILDIVNNINI